MVVYRLAGYGYLQENLTEEIVADFFTGLDASRVERFELPKLWALTFLLVDALAGGARRSLHVDTQGKLLGNAALDIRLPRPDNLDDMIPAED